MGSQRCQSVIEADISSEGQEDINDTYVPTL